MTNRPLYISFNNKNINLTVGYVDNLCVHSSNRKQGIAPNLIQTQYYQIQHMNDKLKVYLFKREGDMTAIVPLTTYKTFTYDILIFQN